MRILSLLSALLCLVLLSLPLLYKRTDQFARNRVVHLIGPKGSCTGVEVRSPKGVRYTLTAGHCKGILDPKGMAIAVTEQGKKQLVQFMVEDPNSDLMLVSPVGTFEVDVAEGTYKHEHVHTMTHGDAMPAYRTDGEMLEERTMDLPLALITSPTDLIACSMPKYRIGFFNSGTFLIPACYFKSAQMFTTAMVLHGSSGGPLFNEDNQLVGIVSTLQPTGLSTFVTLKDIKNFLKDK